VDKNEIKACRSVILLTLFLLMPTFSYAQEAVITLRSTVTGNQEQPKVLYLVPWQNAERPESLYQPMQSLVKTLFSPLERSEFLQEVDYRQQVRPTQLDSMDSK